MSAPAVSAPASTAKLDALPHDIKGLLAYQFTLPGWAWWLGGVLIAAGIVVLAWWWWRRRCKSRVPAPVDPWLVLNAEVRALALPDGAKAAAEFFYGLSMNLRQGIELTTPVRATDRTYRELVVPLRRELRLPHDKVSALLQLLEHAEMVKFAGMPATSDEADRARQRTLDWLRVLKDMQEWQQQEAEQRQSASSVATTVKSSSPGGSTTHG